MKVQQRRWYQPSTRDRRWLLSLAVFASVAFAGWGVFRHQLAMHFVLRSGAPAESVLSGLVGETEDKTGTLRQMWQSGDLTTRAFVMEFLKSCLVTNPLLTIHLKDIVTEAARDPDVAAREPAFRLLAQTAQPEFPALLRRQLTDPDPAIRVMALQELCRVANSNDVPVGIRMLEDPDARVVVQAAAMLRRVTGLDFGIRMSQALPKFSRTDDEPVLSEPDLTPIQRGVKRWQGWWASHQTEFPDSTLPERIATIPLPLHDFGLEALDGRAERLSDFLGKPLLLCFWRIGETSSFDDVAVLKRLQENETNRLAVVGVAFDPSVGPQDDCAEHGGHEHHHDHAHMSNGSAGQTSLHCAVTDIIEQKKIAFPVLLDKKGTAVFRFNVQDVPTYILVNTQGDLSRRFVGSRSLEVFESLVNPKATSSDGQTSTFAQETHP